MLKMKDSFLKRSFNGLCFLWEIFLEKTNRLKSKEVKTMKCKGNLKFLAMAAVMASFLLVNTTAWSARIISRGVKLPPKSMTEGKTLKVLGMPYPNTKAEAEIKDEFEKLTGMKVEYTFMPWEGCIDKIKVEIATKSSSYDIFFTDALMRPVLNPMEGFAYWDDFMADPNLPDLHPETLAGRMMEQYYTYKGKIVGIPCYYDFKVLAYRKDLFSDPKEKADFLEKYGYSLRVPQTWDEFMDASEFFTRDTDGDGKIDFWGWSTGFGGQGPAFDQLSDMYESYNPIEDGRYWMNEKHEPIFNNPKAYHALEQLVYLAQSGFTAPGYMKREWGDSVEDLGAGKAAMAHDWVDALIPVAVSPIVAGKIGFARVPKYEAYNTRVSAMDYAINRYSKHPDLAYTYLVWAHSEENDLRKALETKGSACPVRIASVFNMDLLEKLPMYLVGLWYMMHSETNIAWPQFPEFEEVYRIVSVAIQKALIGDETPKEALDKAAEEVREVMERAGYYK